MIGVRARYKELLIDLLFRRVLAGGRLPDEVESQAAAELDRCWWALSSEEQDELEEELRTTPLAPDVLDEEDQEVGAGQQILARRAA